MLCCWQSCNRRSLRCLLFARHCVRATNLGNRLQQCRRPMPGAAPHSPSLLRCVCLTLLFALISISIHRFNFVNVHRSVRVGMSQGMSRWRTPPRRALFTVCDDSNSGTSRTSGCAMSTCSWYGPICSTCGAERQQCRLQCTTPLAICQLYLPFNRSMLLLAPVAFHQVSLLGVADLRILISSFLLFDCRAARARHPMNSVGLV